MNIIICYKDTSKGISYLGIFVLWDKIYPINGVIRPSTPPNSRINC